MSITSSISFRLFSGIFESKSSIIGTMILIEHFQNQWDHNIFRY
jgi:hypothetical protein